MTIKERVDGVIERFESANPHPQTALHYGTPYQFLVAVLLSAQCTDERINMVTPALFAAYPSPLEMSRASEEEILTYIRSVTYPNSKARYLKQSAESIVQDHGGTVPETLKELMSLQGVGRKTANVYLSVIIGEPRIGVDTHVYRVSRRIGWSLRQPITSSRWRSLLCAASRGSTGIASITGSSSMVVRSALRAIPTASPARSPTTADTTHVGTMPVV